MQSRLHFLLALNLFFLFAAHTTVQGQFLAEVISADAAFCESGEVTIEITFGDTFEAPFEAYIIITKPDGSMVEKWLTDPYYPSAHDNNFTFSQTKFFDFATMGTYGELTISIDEARDKNSDFSSDNVTGETKVTLFKTPSSPFSAGEDIETCGLSTLLNATPGTESNSYFWETVTGASFSDPQLTNPLFTADEDGTFNVSFTQTNGVCSVSDEVSVTLFGNPSASLSTESEICGTGDAEIDFMLQGYGPWTVNYTYSGESEQFTTPNINPIQTHALTGETIFQLQSVSDVNGCSTSYTNEAGTTAKVIDLLPTANAGNDREVCGNKITLSAADPLIGTGTWSGGGSFSNINGFGSSFESDPFTGETLKTLTWTVKNKDCSVSDEVNVTFYEQLETTDISAGKDTILFEQKSFTLEAIPPPFGEGSWSITSGNGLIMQTNDPNAEITQLDFGQTLVRWTVSNGECAPVWHEIGLWVQGIQHPTGFSPNGDDINDLLLIPGAQTIENNQLIVFNTQGKVVYKTSNYQNNWNGTKQNGEDLPDGYYYYVFTGKDVNIKDYLIIKRSKR